MILHIVKFFRQFFNSVLDFVYPQTCLLCDNRFEGEDPVCPGCWNGFMDSLDVTVQRGREDFHHLTGEIFFDEVITCWAYTPEMETLIHRVKYQRGKKLGILLGRIAGEALGETFLYWTDGMMIPVPLHSIRKRYRGYNQSELLCRGLAEGIPVAVYPNLLIRNRNTSTQTKLTAQERQENVRHAFVIRQQDRLVGKRVILVDDVSTTGATLNSCAYVLRGAGVEKIVGLALARPRLE